MDYQTKRIIADLVASGMVVALAAYYGGNTTVAILMVGLINTLNVTEAVKALRTAQARKQAEAAEDARR